MNKNLFHTLARLTVLTAILTACTQVAAPVSPTATLRPSDTPLPPTATIVPTTESSLAQLSFTDSGQAIGNKGYHIAIGDLNHDGYLDVYISANFNALGDPGQIWFNNGKGGFTSGQTIGHERLRHNVAFADLDGDGDLDLFIANDSSLQDPAFEEGYPNEVWLNDGTGKFTDSGQRLGKEPSSAVALGDIDGDGDVDAVVSNYHTANGTSFKPNEIWLNDGHGNFTISDQTLGTGMGRVVLADIDGDKDLDVSVNNAIWVNDGKGNFTKSTQPLGKDSEIAFGDLDGDGDQDAFFTSREGPSEVWLNDGKGTFTDSRQRLGNPESNYVALGDVDGDGDLDAFVSNYDKQNILWINQGGKQGGTPGTFKESEISFPKMGNTAEVRLVDFNNDGRLDAFVVNSDKPGEVWLNTTP
jgi:hypothetical protein